MLYSTNFQFLTLFLVLCSYFGRTCRLVPVRLLTLCSATRTPTARHTVCTKLQHRRVCELCVYSVQVRQVGQCTTGSLVTDITENIFFFVFETKIVFGPLLLPSILVAIVLGSKPKDTERNFRYP